MTHLKHRLVSNIITDRRIFELILDQRKSEGISPSLITFIVPNWSLFSIFRLLKLAEFHRAGFEIVIVIEPSTNGKNDIRFTEIIDKFIPTRKQISYYDDIMQDSQLQTEYHDVISVYQSRSIVSLMEHKNEIGDFSLLDVNRFITQYLILKSSKRHLDKECDFFLTTSYKDLFFNSIPSLSKEMMPVDLVLENVSLDWSFDEPITELERKLLRGEIDEKKCEYITNVLHSVLAPADKKQLGAVDLIGIISSIKQVMEQRSIASEYHVSKDDFERVVYALNSKLRANIISVVLKNQGLKAEEIRKIVNQRQTRKYTLANITKHLNVLVSAGILSKKKREYMTRVDKIVLNMPLTWLGDEHT